MKKLLLHARVLRS